MSFDTVLKVFDLQKEDIFSDSDKINLSLELLIRNYRVIKGLSIQDKTRILDEIYRNVIFPERKKSSGDNKKVFDFREDEEYIFASFMSCYGMDLYQMCGKLHWKKFMALFKGLTDDTKIKEVMSIRSREIPAPTKYNQKEIQSLRELKAYYALGKVEENYRDGLNALFNTLERMAKRK
jgi:hypothetical protein